MSVRRLIRLASVLFGLAVAVGAAAAEAGTSLAVTVDGGFREWKEVEPLDDDPTGDGATGGVDLGRLSVANDNEALFLRFEVGRETILQNGPFEPAGNRLRLLLDLDDTAGTGRPLDGLGVEIEIRLGERSIEVFSAGGTPSAATPAELGIAALPTHSAHEFEVRVPFAAAGSEALAERLAEGGSLALVLAETNGDRQPDSGRITYRVATEPVDPPRSIGLEKRRDRFIRLLTMNVSSTSIRTRQETYRRILAALAPDIIALQEVYDWSSGQTRDFIADALPLGDGRRWTVFQVADTVTLSSYPILAGSAIDGNHVVHIDLPDELTVHDLVLFNAHTPCCSNDAERDEEHDRLMMTWRDLLQDTGPFPIAPRDAVILAGDFNMVGFRRQLDVLLHGRFIDPANGPDFEPGRSKRSLKVAPLVHSNRRLVHTWRRDVSSYSPGRLDWVIYSKDVARPRKSYILDTEALTDEVLAAFGLERGDSLAASDHLALVTDFKLKKR